MTGFGRIRHGLAALAILSLAGCFSVGSTGTPQRVWYVLDDAGAAVTQRAAGGAPVETAVPLRVIGTANSDFYEARALAYSRASGTRSYFLYANWTEQPAPRIARLFEDRVLATRALDYGGGGGKPDRSVLLRLALEELFLDVSVDPAQVRIAIELSVESAGPIDAAPLRRMFRVDEAIDRADAAGMAAGANRALARIFDQMLAWLTRSR